jgi:urease gamma subunit
MLSGVARERQLAGLKQNQDDTVLLNSAKREEPLHAVERAAGLFDIGHDSVSRAKEVAEEAPGLLPQVQRAAP